MGWKKALKEFGKGRKRGKDNERQTKRKGVDGARGRPEEEKDG